MTPLLTGLRIVDLTSVIMGPFATAQLGALGADVIKVEPPSGEAVRHIGPMKSPEMGAMFLNANRNKRSVVLDLKTAEGRAALDAILATADVIVHNMRRKAAAKIGIDAETLMAKHANLIYCSAVGFGKGGCYQDDAAYDDVVQALSGFAAVNANAAGEPRYIPQIAIDKISGLFIVQGILAALLHRARTGTARAFEVTMLECAAHFLLYSAGDRRYALNVLREDAALAAQGAFPSGVVVETLALTGERRFKAELLMLALALLAIDVLATLWVSGRLRGRAARPSVAAALAVICVAASVQPIRAQDDPDAIARYAANQTVLAYVITGDQRVDDRSRAGLSGLSRVLTLRTAIEPSEPLGVDPESDELSFFPFLYWPVTEEQRDLSDEAYAKLNAYLRTGGMIMFDTRDAPLGGSLSGTPNGRQLQRIARGLDIPPLEQVPPDHVLTRTFYLLQDFPGRYANTPVWVEAAPNAEDVEGLPFRNLNDGVTPVIIGANDWASAWALSSEGTPLFPVGRGAGGSQQRELAFRFGVNLIMHVMTGNYKSDQVHVPALLERLGQ